MKGETQGPWEPMSIKEWYQRHDGTPLCTPVEQPELESGYKQWRGLDRQYGQPRPIPAAIPSKGAATSIALLRERVERLEDWARDVQEALGSILDCLDGLELEPASDNEEEGDL